jgi:NAD(P)H-flavin reductase
MGQCIGRVSEIRLGSGRKVELYITCPVSLIPPAGQFVMALDESTLDEVIRTPIFAIERTRQGFWAAPLHPVKWSPGTTLELVGPMGHGFDLPAKIERLGMAALGDTAARLMPLVHQAASTQAGSTLFSDLDIPALPAAVEVSPLASLRDSLDWPDMLVLDMPVERLPELRCLLGLQDRAWLPCPAQVLLTTCMPCAGMAQCGACAVPGSRGWKLVCEDGPVFDLRMLKW